MKYLKSALIALLVIFVLGTSSVIGAYFYIKADLPSVDILKDVRLQTPMRVYSQDGKLISQYGVKRRIPLTVEQIPENLKYAVIATEDSRFYSHYGVDPIGMIRAAVNLIVTGEKGQGGSTLTMQLARGFFLTREKKFIRKIREIVIALHIEQLLSKPEILQLYMNKVELGHRSFGFGAAARVYYGKPLDQLSLAQIATLAGLPQAPSVLNPVSRPERSVARRRIVLLRMLDEGYITRAQFDQAAAAPVTAKKHGAEIELDAPYLADIIYNEMVDTYGKEEAETGGYRVYATVQSHMQQAAQRAVRQNLHDYDERHGYRGPEKILWTAQGDAPSAVEQLPLSERLPLSEEDMLAELNQHQTYSPFEPAIVVKVNERDIIIFNKQGQYSLIDWDGLDWARGYVNDSKQAKAPTKAADIVQAGSLILIRKRLNDGHWQLAQFPEASSAFVALDPNNGAAQAIVGGYSFYQSQFNRATQAKRQVGSNIKPFVYSAAIEQGMTLASVINDAPITQWQAGSGNAWRPTNSPPVYNGPLRMRVALAKSKNVVSVRLLRSVGIDEVTQHLSKFGFDKSEVPQDETMSLGSGSHTPLEIATGMAVIANGGFLVEPHFIQRIENEYGELVWQADPARACDPCVEPPVDIAAIDSNDIEALLAAEFAKNNQIEQGPTQPIRQAPRVISAENAFLVAEMMRSAVQINGHWDNRGTGWRTALLLKRDDVAGKTGTTNDVKDTWFSGFTPDLVATAWVGFDDNNRRLGKVSVNRNLVNKNPMKFNYIGNAMIGTEAGALAAQPAWIRFMQHALNDVPEHPLPMPSDLVTVRIDKNTGKLTDRTDKTSMFEYFIRGTEPSDYVTDEEIVEATGSSDEAGQQFEDIF